MKVSFKKKRINKAKEKIRGRRGRRGKNKLALAS